MKLLQLKGWLSQGFGLNDVDYKLYGLKGHPCVDYAQGFNLPIQACADGKVYKIVNIKHSIFYKDFKQKSIDKLGLICEVIPEEINLIV